jgi:histidinol-phosphate aminotransferase
MDLDKLAKPYLQKVVPYKPGKPIEQAQREGRSTKPIIKLASNENPYPPPERIKQAVIAEMEVANRYPESGSPELTEALAKRHGVDMDEVFVANGTNEIIDLLIRSYVNEDENVVFSHLSFAIYKIVSMQCGAGFKEIPCRDYTHDLKAMAAAIDDKTKIVFVCNPNNPTATYNSTDEVNALLERVPDHTLVVLDEAYYDFVNAPDYPDGLTLRRNHPNLIVLRTFSKFYSLAGIRVGYAVADRQVVDILHKARQPFNVHRLAQAAALAALHCTEELKWIIDETIRERERLREAILKLDCECPPTQTNFLFVIPKRHSGDICKALEVEGVIVRPMVHFGAPENSFRVNTGTPEENDRFLEALGTLLTAA